MIQSPIHKALLTFQNCNVRFLLMGGQACILYGGAEFSRDIDLSIGVDADNLSAVNRALTQLQANVVFFPDLSADALLRGHACHFRCQNEGVEGLRIDLMTKMRGCPEFAELWERRSIVNLPEIGNIGLLSLPDLVQAKKTQREKDWPMIYMHWKNTCSPRKEPKRQETNSTGSPCGWNWSSGVADETSKTARALYS